MSFTFFIMQLAFRSEPLVSIGATHGKIIKGIGNILDRKKNEIYLVHKYIYQPCTKRRGNLGLLIP